MVKGGPTHPGSSVLLVLAKGGLAHPNEIWELGITVIICNLIWGLCINVIICNLIWELGIKVTVCNLIRELGITVTVYEKHLLKSDVI